MVEDFEKWCIQEQWLSLDEIQEIRSDPYGNRFLTSTYTYPLNLEAPVSTSRGSPPVSRDVDSFKQVKLLKRQTERPPQAESPNNDTFSNIPGEFPINPASVSPPNKPQESTSHIFKRSHTSFQDQQPEPSGRSYRSNSTLPPFPSTDETKRGEECGSAEKGGSGGVHDVPSVDMDSDVAAGVSHDNLPGRAEAEAEAEAVAASLAPQGHSGTAQSDIQDTRKEYLDFTTHPSTADRNDLPPNASVADERERRRVDERLKDDEDDDNSRSSGGVRSTPIDQIGMTPKDCTGTTPHRPRRTSPDDSESQREDAQLRGGFDLNLEVEELSAKDLGTESLTGLDTEILNGMDETRDLPRCHLQKQRGTRTSTSSGVIRDDKDERPSVSKSDPSAIQMQKCSDSKFSNSPELQAHPTPPLENNNRQDRSECANSCDESGGKCRIDMNNAGTSVTADDIVAEGNSCKESNEQVELSGEAEEEGCEREEMEGEGSGQAEEEGCEREEMEGEFSGQTEEEGCEREEMEGEFSGQTEEEGCEREEMLGEGSGQAEEEGCDREEMEGEGLGQTEVEACESEEMEGEEDEDVVEIYFEEEESGFEMEIDSEMRDGDASTRDRDVSDTKEDCKGTPEMGEESSGDEEHRVSGLSDEEMEGCSFGRGEKGVESESTAEKRENCEGEKKSDEDSDVECVWSPEEILQARREWEQARRQRNSEGSKSSKSEPLNLNEMMGDENPANFFRSCAPQHNASCEEIDVDAIPDVSGEDFGGAQEKVENGVGQGADPIHPWADHSEFGASPFEGSPARNHPTQRDERATSNKENDEVRTRTEIGNKRASHLGENQKMPSKRAPVYHFKEVEVNGHVEVDLCDSDEDLDEEYEPSYTTSHPTGVYSNAEQEKADSLKMKRPATNDARTAKTVGSDKPSEHPFQTSAGVFYYAFPFPLKTSTQDSKTATREHQQHQNHEDHYSQSQHTHNPHYPHHRFKPHIRPRRQSANLNPRSEAQGTEAVQTHTRRRQSDTTTDSSVNSDGSEVRAGHQPDDGLHDRQHHKERRKDSSEEAPMETSQNQAGKILEEGNGPTCGAKRERCDSEDGGGGVATADAGRGAGEDAGAATFSGCGTNTSIGACVGGSSGGGDGGSGEDDAAFVLDRRSHVDAEADQREWELRQEEVRKQSEDVQRERKRLKMEAMKKAALSARLAERVEEFRRRREDEQTQQGDKDALRASVRAKLEVRLEYCFTARSTLIMLGVNVEGGHSASPKQEAAAYKQALRKFHPDRIKAKSANKKLSLRDEIEAEETFKLLQEKCGSLIARTQR